MHRISFLFILLINRSNYCISHQTAEEEIKKNMILETDYLIYLKRFGIIFVVTAVLSGSLYQNKYTNEYIREDIPIYYETCGADILNMILALACSVYIYITIFILFHI